MIRIAFAEDRPGGIEKIITFLKQTGMFSIEVVAGNGYELVQKIYYAPLPPHIIFTDINMPIMDGIATSFYLSHHYPSSKIISMSAYFDDAIIQQAIESGAHGYLIKPEAETLVISAIETVLNDRIYLDPRAMVNENITTLIHSMVKQYPACNEFKLTPREKTFVMLNATPLSWEQIAKLVFVELKTVQTYFDRVAKKLDVHSRQGLTLFSLQNGLAKNARYSSALPA